VDSVELAESLVQWRDYFTMVMCPLIQWIHGIALPNENHQLVKRKP
jgi:hypothetical protein